MSAFDPLESVRPVADSTRIDLDRPNEIAHWCRQFSCTEHDLMAAVAAVGAQPEAVRNQVERSWW